MLGVGAFFVIYGEPINLEIIPAGEDWFLRSSLLETEPSKVISWLSLALAAESLKLSLFC